MMTLLEDNGKVERETSVVPACWCVWSSRLARQWVTLDLSDVQRGAQECRRGVYTSSTPPIGMLTLPILTTQIYHLCVAPVQK